MRRFIPLLTFAALVLPAAAGAQLHERTVVATTERQEIRAPGLVESHYAVGYRTFTAFSAGQPFCRDFGRYGDVRVKESSCNGPLVVTIRSVGEPTEVVVGWQD